MIIVNHYITCQEHLKITTQMFEGGISKPNILRIS